MIQTAVAAVARRSIGFVRLQPTLWGRSTRASAEVARNTLAAAAQQGHTRHLATGPSVKDMDEATFNAELKKAGMISKVKMLLQRYGITAIFTYGGLYASTVGAGFGTFHLFDNFGVEPLDLLQQMGLKEDVLNLLGMDPHLTALSPWQTSAILTFLLLEVSEPFRVMGTLYLAPILHRRWHPQPAGTSAAGHDGENGGVLPPPPAPPAGTPSEAQNPR